MRGVEGAWDVHVHCAPSLFPRWGDAWELAEVCREAGLAGVVLKAHHGSTVEAAAQLDRRLGVRVLGGLTLSGFVGGLNPLAVERSVALGAAIIWMPTIHAAHHGRVIGRLGGFPFQDHPLRHTPTEGITVLGQDGRLTAAARDVLDVLDGTGVVLGTGHLSFPEIRALRRAVDEPGRDLRLLVNHALFTVPALDEVALREVAGERVWIELCYLSTLHGLPIERVAGAMAAVPRAQWVLATDSGQTTTPPAPEALSAFVDALSGAGVGGEALGRAIREAPERMLAQSSRVSGTPV